MQSTHLFNNIEEASPLFPEKKLNNCLPVSTDMIQTVMVSERHAAPILHQPGRHSDFVLKKCISLVEYMSYKTCPAV